MEIKNYEIISGIGVNEINNKVADYIQKGWQPFGGVAVNNWTEPFSSDTKVSKTQYSQVMVKYNE